MIDKSNFTDVIENVTLTKVCTVKADSEATESKTVTVNVKYDGLRLADVFEKALSSDIIKWQVSARKHYNVIDSIANISAKAPGRAPQVDPETAVVNKAVSMTPEERREYLENINRQIKALG